MDKLKNWYHRNHKIVEVSLYAASVSIYVGVVVYLVRGERIVEAIADIGVYDDAPNEIVETLLLVKRNGSGDLMAKVVSPEVLRKRIDSLTKNLDEFEKQQKK